MSADAAPDGAPASCYFRFADEWGRAPRSPTLHVAFVGNDTEAILRGFRLQPGTRVALVHAKADKGRAREARDALRDAGIEARLHRSDDATFLGTLRALNALLAEGRLTHERIVVNVGTGTRDAGCAGIAAAYLHGLEAFLEVDDALCALPTVPVGQREVLSANDARILSILQAAPRSLRALARATGIERARVRAHVEGEPSHNGLVALGLVERPRPRLFGRLRLSASGRALVEGGALTSGSPTV